MNKKIFIIIGVILMLTIAIFTILMVINKNDEKFLDSKITIKYYTYNEDKKEVQEIVIEDKEKIQELINYRNTILSAEKLDLNLAIFNEIVIEFENNSSIVIQTSLNEYCYYKDESTTKLVEIPEGLLSLIKKELKIENEGENND